MVNTEQCKGCYFWKNINSSGTAYKGSEKCCHYLIITGECKKRDGDKCLSRRLMRRKVKQCG